MYVQYKQVYVYESRLVYTVRLDPSVLANIQGEAHNSNNTKFNKDVFK